MKIGYARVSSSGQETERQVIALQEAGCEKIFTEKVSGKSSENRPVLKDMIAFSREKDTILVSDISRLARSTRDLLSILAEVTSKGVGFISLKESIDTTTPQGRFVLTIFGALAELERESILQRQKEGIAIAKSKKIHMGRPRVQLPSNWSTVISEWKSGQISTVQAISKTNMNRGTFYKVIRENRS